MRQMKTYDKLIKERWPETGPDTMVYAVPVITKDGQRMPDPNKCKIYYTASACGLGPVMVEGVIEEVEMEELQDDVWAGYSKKYKILFVARGETHV